MSFSGNTSRGLRAGRRVNTIRTLSLGTPPAPAPVEHDNGYPEGIRDAEDGLFIQLTRHLQYHPWTKG